MESEFHSNMSKEGILKLYHAATPPSQQTYPCQFVVSHQCGGVAHLSPEPDTSMLFEDKS